MAAISCITIIFFCLSSASCTNSTSVPAHPGDRLVPEITYSADFDGDGISETVLIESDPASLTIEDGSTVYHSRDKWHIVEAFLGDTDHNGLPEVVTLLDAEDGRHLGLFAYFGGDYRERFVTSALTPRPLSLQVHTAGPAGDSILVTEECEADDTTSQDIVYQWNGFGFAIN